MSAHVVLNVQEVFFVFSTI